MPGDDAYSVALFHISSAVLRSEKILAGKGFKTKLIPVPRSLSSDCGIALRFDTDAETQVREILETSGVAIDSIHPMP